MAVFILSAVKNSIFKNPWRRTVAILRSSIQRVNKPKPNFHIWVGMQNLMFLTCLDGPKVRFSKLHFSTARGTNSRHVAAYNTECHQTYHSAKVTCFIGPVPKVIEILFLKFYWLSHRLMGHGSIGNKYWPMSYVTHADMLTHLTHDPLTHCQLCSALDTQHIGVRLSVWLRSFE